LAIALTVAGCGSDATSGERVCAPGKVEECACVGGLTKGAQTCEDDGSAWGKCECPGAQPASGGGSGAGATHCTPGTDASCDCCTTRGNDVVASGTKSCDTEGNWTACGGPVCDESHAIPNYCVD